MMALAEKLRERASAIRRTAQITCGELGEVTIEALSLRDAELLFRGGDGERRIFYAACRELQRTGEEMRKRGEIAAPDGILQFISDAEAEAAAQAVLALSGITPPLQEERPAPPEGAAPAAAPKAAEPQEETPAAPQPLPPVIPAPAANTQVISASGTPSGDEEPALTETAQTLDGTPPPAASAAETLPEAIIPETPAEPQTDNAAPASPASAAGDVPPVPTLLTKSESADEGAAAPEAPKAPVPQTLPEPETAAAPPQPFVSAPLQAAQRGGRTAPEALREAGGNAVGEALFRSHAADTGVHNPIPSAPSDAALAERMARELLAGLRRAAYVR